jgi:hypothetical protein
MSRRKTKRLELSPAEPRTPPRYQIESELVERAIDIEPLPQKRYLILCEGETEQAYFEGLKSNQILQFKLASVDVDVVAPDQLIDNNLKGLIWEAIQRYRKSIEDENPYDEIWVVIDNDNRNGPWLSPASLERVKHLLNPSEFKQLSKHLNRHFLCRADLMATLEMNLGYRRREIREIADLTDRLTLLEDMNARDPRKLFFKDGAFAYGQDREAGKRPAAEDFDPTWKEYVHIAYSAISFETWLLLHFERTANTFTTSRGLVQYIQQHAPLFEKGRGNRTRNQANAYEMLKPTPLSRKYETTEDAVIALGRIKFAVENGYWLRQAIDEQCLRRGLEYYETIPYTTVQELTASLLGANGRLYWGRFNATIQWHGLELAFRFSAESSAVHFSISNLSNLRILINSANASRFFSIHAPAGSGGGEPVFPASMPTGTINLLPGEHGQGRIQFYLPNDETERFLHVRFEGLTEDVIVIPLVSGY